MRIAIIAVLAVIVTAGALAILFRGRPSPPAAVVVAAGPASPAGTIRVWSEDAKAYVVVPRVVKTDDEWKKELAPLDYAVTREAGTERAFTGRYWDNHEHGIYRCVACGTDLFRSETKFESGTGWPSFYAPIAPENVETRQDRTLFMVRTEVLCPRCGAHLGHVFPDGPKPTGQRYCLNSAALRFEKRKP